MHSIFYKEVKSRKIKHGYVEIYMDNLKLYLDDIKIIDKLSLFFIKMINCVLKYPFTENKLDEIVDESKIELHDKLTVNMNNFETVVNSLDPITGEIFNKLYLNVSCLSMGKQNGPGYDRLELSIYYFTFGFNFSKNNDYPMIILPIAELSIEDGSVFRVNVPCNCINKVKQFDKIYKNPLQRLKSLTPLDNFVINTQSLTLFLNFAYLNTFYKIFENLWKRSDFMKTYFVSSSPQSSKQQPSMSQSLTRSNNRNIKNISSIINTDINYSMCISNEEEKLSKITKLMVTVFDLKIIYLINYKSDFDSVFTFHKNIKEQGYFGYIIRLFSSAIRYDVSSIKEENINQIFSSKAKQALIDELKVNLNLLTITSLNEENLNDEKFFKQDNEINQNNFINLKIPKNFSDFMELPQRQYLLINDVFFSQFELSSEATSIVNYIDLPFECQSTLIKIFDIELTRESLNVQNFEEIYTKINGLKIAWNKMNMDTINILVFQDILNIVDKILIKIKIPKKENEVAQSSNKNIFDLGRFNFIFESSDLQICIENEIKKAKVLLTTKSKCVLKLSKLCLNENSKNFKLEILIKDMMLYIPPSLSDDKSIYWIGKESESKFYLDAKLFSQMVCIPNISFGIKEEIYHEDNDNKILSYIDITVDKLVGDFAPSYFENFMNIIEVFIFSRGSSLAEEKISLDSRDEDLKKYKLEDLKMKIKEHLLPPSKIKCKQISFSIKDIIMTLLKENKEVIKLLMRRFEGDHIINNDKSSETTINISNLKILDLLKIKNEVILSQVNDNRYGNFENKIEMIRFRKKDSYVSIGTESKWYVMDYLEIALQPVSINVTKYHCDFILAFFFNTTTNNETSLSEEEYKKMLINSKSESSIAEDKKSDSIMSDNKKKTDTATNKQNEVSVDYPIYFKHVRINESKLNVSFFFSDGSPWNLKEAKVKFTEFEKKEKFYSSNTLIYRLIHHLKMMGIKNVGNVLASMLFDRNEHTQKKKEDEESHKKLLFGSLYSK